LQYAQDEEEYHAGVRCLAAPVFDMRGQVVAAVGVTGPTSSFTTDKTASVCHLVRQASEELSRALGYKP
jgi:IclR family acetate operon transcriptional repressor